MTDRMREVELVDVDGPGALHPRPHADGEPASVDVRAASGRSWFRRHARWLVPTAVVAVVALVGTQVVLDARERSRLEALAQVPGVVPPTGPDIGVAWRADPDLATVLQGGTKIGDVLIGGRSSGTDSFDLVALDLDTGATRWTTPVQLPTAHQTPEGSYPTSWVGCVPVQHGERALAACVSGQYGDNIVGLPNSATWVVDPADGAVLAHTVVPGTSGVAFTDDALVVATRTAADSDKPADAVASSVRWRVTATDLVSGAPIWTWTTPVIDTRGREDGPEAANASGSATLRTFDDELVLAVDLHTWILRDDGSVVRDIPLGPASWIEGLRSGVYIESTYMSAVDTGTLLLADGSSVPIDESAGMLWIDDGSAPGMLFTVTARDNGVVGLTGRDATTGAQVWHLDEPVTAAMLLDGVLYLTTEGALEALDAATGRTRWSTPLDFVPQQLSTDGRYVLLPALGVTLRAYSMSSGRLAWTKDLRTEAAGDRDPIYVQGFQANWHDPRLYVWMDDGAVAVLG